MLKKAEKMATDAGFTPKAVPVKLLFPMLEGASLEENESLHDMWAALLANASSGGMKGKVRAGFISTLKQMEPDEAALLNEFPGSDSEVDEADLATYFDKLGFPKNDVVECLCGLQAAGLIRRGVMAHPPSIFGDSLRPRLVDDLSPYFITERGIAFLAACTPPKPKS